MGASWDETPSYLRLGIDELKARARQALALLGQERCTVCPRLCKVDRSADHKGLCAIGRQAVVASYFAHFGEENCLRGWNGSGTIFFSGCNLRCVFCQNHDISWEVRGERVTPARLAEMMLELEARGCHNINWVTPEHVVPQILEALPLAVAGGLQLPIIYNTSAYDSLDSLQLMDGIVDIYMPDFKVWSQPAARRYLRRPDYAEVARGAVKEMARQVGPLVVDSDRLARRGLLLRHLVMPGMLAETEGGAAVCGRGVGAGHLCGPDGPVLSGRPGRQGRPGRLWRDRPPPVPGGVPAGGRHRPRPGVAAGCPQRRQRSPAGSRRRHDLTLPSRSHAYSSTGRRQR
jgi:putative pyruvate formate lyase activating enzyme